MSDQRTAKQWGEKDDESLVKRLRSRDVDIMGYALCEEAAKEIERLQRDLEYAKADYHHELAKQIRVADETAVLCPACQELRTLRKIVKAWEALPGGRNYSYHEIQDWLIEDMKPAIDAARKVIKEQSK